MSNKEIQETMAEENTPVIENKLEEVLEEINEIPAEEKTIPNGFSKEQIDQLKPMFPFLEEEYKKFEYGDLHVHCGQCGSSTAMLHPQMRNLQTAYITQTNIDNHSLLSLACAVCGNRLALHVKQAVNPPKNDNSSTENKETAENDTREKSK